MGCCASSTFAVAGQGRVEAFAVGTRLTCLTRQLSSRDSATALQQAIEQVLDWSGGTRLGEGIGTFNNRFGMPGMARGAIVVILSDGLDRGDPAFLSGEMARLHRAAHRTIWVNPLKASVGYEPLARGMAAALPVCRSVRRGSFRRVARCAGGRDRGQ